MDIEEITQNTNYILVWFWMFDRLMYSKEGTIHNSSLHCDDPLVGDLLLVVSLGESYLLESKSELHRIG